MVLPNKEEGKVPKLTPPNETIDLRNWLYLNELLAKGNLYTIQPFAKNISCFPQTDEKALLLKTTLHNSINSKKSS